MINYILKKLKENYNVYAALNGNEAKKKLKALKYNQISSSLMS